MSSFDDLIAKLKSRSSTFQLGMDSYRFFLLAEHFHATLMIDTGGRYFSIKPSNIWRNRAKPIKSGSPVKILVNGAFMALVIWNLLIEEIEPETAFIYLIGRDMTRDGYVRKKRWKEKVLRKEKQSVVPIHINESKFEEVYTKLQRIQSISVEEEEVATWVKLDESSWVSWDFK